MTSRARATATTQHILCAVLSVLAGCTASTPDYADAQDIAAAELAFGCADQPGELFARACRTLGAFRRAGPVLPVLPVGFGSDVYVGESICSHSSGHAFDVFTLSHGTSVSAAEPARRPTGNISWCIRRAFTSGFVPPPLAYWRPFAVVLPRLGLKALEMSYRVSGRVGVAHVPSQPKQR